MTTAVATKKAEKFEKLAASFDRAAEDLLRERATHTPKKRREAAQQHCRGLAAKRAADLCRAVAQFHAAPDVRPSDVRIASLVLTALEGLKSKADIERTVSRRTDSSPGYSVETDEYHDMSPASVALRGWAAARRPVADVEAEAKIKTEQKIKQLEEEFRFAKIPGFFPTPPAVIQRMIELADLEDGMTLLEPSAGKGDILDAVRATGKKIEARFVERIHRLAELCELKGHKPHPESALAENDFLRIAGRIAFDRILMNPPFEKGQDIEHVQTAYSHLSPGGRLVAVMSTGPWHRSDKAARGFRDWLHNLRVSGRDALVRDLEAAAFKAGFVTTGVSCKLLVLTR